MRVLIIDGQGGGLGRQLVTAVKEYDQDIEVLAVGTNMRRGRTPWLSHLKGLM